MDIYTFIVMLHVVGTILGTGGATVAELQIMRALKDKRVSMEERALMHVNYCMIRAGMAIILVSVLGMFWYFEAHGGSNPMFSDDKLLIKELMFAAIFVNAVLLHKRLVPLWLGASISFTSWWGATLLGLAGQLPYSFITYLTGYIIAVFALAGFFHLLRMWSAMGLLNTRTTVLSFAVVLFMVAATIFYLIQGEVLRSELADEADATESAYYRTLSETVGFEYPGGTHNIKFDIHLNEARTIERIDAADIDPENQGKIADFVVLINEQMVGRALPNATAESRVGSASLTTAAWNEAIERLQAEL